MDEQQKKDSRSVIILIFPVGLLFLSLVLLFALGFRFYFKSNNHNDTTQIAAADKKETVTLKAPQKTNLRDSLQSVYRATVNELDNRLDSIWNNTDTTDGNLEVKLNEFYKLRKEITGLLKTGSSDTDLALAGQKINDLQQKIIELTQHTQNVEEENKRLKELVTQLQKKPEQKEQPVVIKPVNTETKPVTPKTTVTIPAPSAVTISANGLTASDIRLSAVKLANDKEEETTDAAQAEKLVASFTVKNNNREYDNTEVDIVVLQPDGQVLQSSAWDAGTFNTTEGKRVYSKKLKFDYLKGDNKKLRITLAAEKLQQGNYTLQVYHNGKMIGRTVKQLG
ncbi:MAG: hypothetical protein HY252_04785 [Sphingobacteriales bacterium]|nr:hypothetical protein [Sphingobacteriales bacterium]